MGYLHLMLVRDIVLSVCNSCCCSTGVEPHLLLSRLGRRIRKVSAAEQSRLDTKAAGCSC